ncbi:S1 RNA-binding domain-containing protein [candidate division GN15 bacterium]|nr:S1 RNA-binding domain-containing protein [candidate division GN15 bacterium]
MTDYTTRIAQELSIRPNQVDGTIRLLDDEATVPFIARYRKEATGGLDEVAITTIRDRLVQLRALDERREAIVKSLTERELLTDELQDQLESCETMAQLEDVYLPYRPKRRTRATIAREKGLEPLAELLFGQDNINVEKAAGDYIDPEKDVADVEQALAGARDIIAEWVNEDTDARGRLRAMFEREAMITSKLNRGQEEAGAKYRDYFEWHELANQAPSHRLLAMFRGEREGVLRLSIAPEKDRALDLLWGIFLIGANAATQQVRDAVADSYDRLLRPAMETEWRGILKERADQEAIRIFCENVRELLLAPPLGRKRILAIDPGFRTGCKVVCLNHHGSLEHHDTIFPHEKNERGERAAQTIRHLVERFTIEVIAIGNGTAGRETEQFVKELRLGDEVGIVMVNEAGASVYSASEVARDEFPDKDVTVRGAVSIGRRLMDPLAELVKIDPKAIGVGQYQHDVDQKALRSALDDTVLSCVNNVGVELNSASQQLLAYVSGLGPHLAKQIVNWREEHGSFGSRDDLLKVPRLGPKAFEQAAGFLRIAEAANPLDRSAVHPESYPVVQKMARDLQCDIEALVQNETLRQRIDVNRYVSERVGLPTLQDIMSELDRPGRDPRASFEPFAFSQAVTGIEDVQSGMTLPGIVTNVTAFGAFVDIGVHQDGLVHISELADQYVSDPNDIVRVQQRVTVHVLDVDLERRRIALSMRRQSREN